MWVRKWQWDLMNERLDRLERGWHEMHANLAQVSGKLSLSILSDDYSLRDIYSGDKWKIKEIPLVDAVKKITDHLGVKFKQTPETISLEKIKK